MNLNTNNRDPKNSLARISNMGFDPEAELPMVEPLGFDGVNFQRTMAGSMAMVMVTSGNYIYIAVAAPGTTTATAKWQIQRINTSSGLIIDWADGNANFDNSATNPPALSYS